MRRKSRPVFDASAALVFIQEEPGGAPDVDCRSLMQDARISAGVAPTNPPAAVASRPASRASN